jgi:hypothetical protein
VPLVPSERHQFPAFLHRRRNRCRRFSSLDAVEATLLCCFAGDQSCSDDGFEKSRRLLGWSQAARCGSCSHLRSCHTQGEAVSQGCPMSLENPSEWRQVTRGSSARLLGREPAAQALLEEQVRVGTVGKQEALSQLAALAAAKRAVSRGWVVSADSRICTRMSKLSSLRPVVGS